MFPKKYAVVIFICICCCTRSTPQSLPIVNDGIKQIFTDIPRDGSVLSSKDDYLEPEFKMKVEVAGIKFYVHGDSIQLEKKELIVLFSKYTLTGSHGEKEKKRKSSN